MANNSDKLPIKVIRTRSEDIKPIPGGGGGPTFFCEVTQEVRQELLNRFSLFNQVMQEKLGEYPEMPFVGEVKLKKDALAKSHRPTRLFNEKSCPIIGNGKFGELLVEITKSGLAHLAQEVASGTSEQLLANISSVEGIKLVDLRNNTLETDLLISKVEKGEPLKVELFNYSKEIYNKLAYEYFNEFARETQGLEVLESLEYSDSLRVIKVKANNRNVLNQLFDFRGVKRLSFFPEYQLISPQLRSVDINFNSEIIEPVENADYPIIGLVDSGICHDHPILSKWIHAREIYVAEEERNCNHGSFVGGLLVFGDNLTEGALEKFNGVKIVDVIAIPNDDEDYGMVGSLSEDELVEILKEVVPKYKDNVKVWNLSLGADLVCKPDAFSDLAIALDDIQKHNNVIFVVAAGNFTDIPRTWPAQATIGSTDIITSPADSVRAVTVGSISHRETIDSVVRMEQPSPFSRRGPGPNYLVKPELVHYGGNCRNNWDCNNLGAVSFDEDGNLCEGVGTSYSTPRVSSLLSKVIHSLNSTPSNNLAKALMMHSTRQQDVPYIPKEEEIHYYGFGRPANIESIITCTESTATIIYEGELLPGRYIEIPDFPYPTSLLRGGKWFGEIWVTLVYDPPLDARFGQEYCRTNIDVHMGTFEYITKDGKQKLNFTRQVPPEYKLGARYEREMIEHGFKWSPVKLFHRKITKGIAPNPWRLTLDLLTRSGEIISQPQKFALVITIKDDSGKDIYSEVVRDLNQRFLHSDLELKETVKTSLNI